MIEKRDSSAGGTTDIEAEKANVKHKAERLRRFAQELNASSVGITPKWQRAIDNYRRLKSETIADQSQVDA